MQVLLGRKKSGFGVGYLVGLGGHVEDGETARAAVIREVAEECGLMVADAALDERAKVIFHFPAKPGWNQDVRVFVGHDWTGELTESDEIEPLWCDAGALPLDRMWDDARYWLPLILQGKGLDATIEFASDNQMVVRVALSVRLPPFAESQNARTSI